MFKHQYKERTYAEEILKNGFTSKHIKHELKILVKYYKELGYKPKQRKELIYKFCEEHLEGYDRVIHYKLINSVLSYGNSRKNVLIEIDSIPITNEELKYIDRLEIEHDYKKIVFTLLVLNKLNKKFHSNRNEIVNDEYYFGGTRNYKELVSTSKATLKKNKTIHSLIGDLDNKGIIEITGNGSIKLSFMYEIPKDDSVELEINSFDCIGFYYDLHTSENKVKECECCNVPIKIKSNREKYCESCWKEKQKEWQRESMKKSRESKKCEVLEKR